ncbi:MAG: hypothetical protein AAF170_02195 [Bacteroidota bacterium]
MAFASPLSTPLAPRIGLGLGLAVLGLALIVPATVAASCTFMLPVATPANAIAHVTIGEMVRAGVWLNLRSPFW